MARSVGIKGIETPKEGCSDANCPFHGKLAVRGRTFKGTIKSAKMDRSAKVVFERRFRLKKFERYERRFTGMTVHNPPCINAGAGDTVLIMECRPISKTKKFVVLQVIR